MSQHPIARRQMPPGIAVMEDLRSESSDREANRECGNGKGGWNGRLAHGGLTL
jgi:hypothetical protein